MILLDSLLVAAAWLLAASGRRRGIRRSVAAAEPFSLPRRRAKAPGSGCRTRIRSRFLRTPGSLTLRPRRARPPLSLARHSRWS